MNNMKWIIYVVCTCAVVDLALLMYSIDRKVDVFAPGIYVLGLSLLITYTILIVLLIEKKDWFETRILLSIFLLLPCLIYLFIHLLILFLNLISLLKYLD